MNQPHTDQTGRKWKWSVLPLIAAVSLVLSCSISSLGAPAATSTPTVTSTDTPTKTLLPTNTHEPTATRTPTKKPTPTKIPKVTIGEFEQALGDAGYTSEELSSGSGTIWTLDNAFENIFVWNDGKVQLDVLNSVTARLSHMEKKFAVMDGLFPADFMAQLREHNNAYAGTVGAGVTGKASQPYGPVPGDAFKFLSAYYNVSDDAIEPYKIQFALFFEQWTCPSGYICTFPYFGNLQFTGQGSFVFYEVTIWLGK